MFPILSEEDIPFPPLLRDRMMQLVCLLLGLPFTGILESAEKGILVIASKAKQSLFEIAELVPSVSEESHYEFASAVPRNRWRSSQ